MSRVTPVLLYSLTGAVVLSSLSSCKEKKSEEVKKNDECTISCVTTILNSDDQCL